MRKGFCCKCRVGMPSCSYASRRFITCPRSFYAADASSFISKGKIMILPHKKALTCAVFATVILGGCELTHHSNVVVAGKPYQILQLDEITVYDGGPPPKPDLYISPGKGYSLIKCSPNTSEGCIGTLKRALSHTPPKNTSAVSNESVNSHSDSDSHSGGAG